MGAALSRRQATTVCAPPPELPSELIEEILFRLPPDDPACLLRASLICKAWSHTASRPGFRRRLHKRHGAAPVLGFLHNWDNECIPHFVPTVASSFSLAAPDWRSWQAIDCRHGRALFCSKGAWELLVWEPITGAQQRLAVPPAFKICVPFEPAYAVFCAADGCDHRNCLGGPFGVAFAFCFEDEDAADEEYVTSACVYSSEHGTWGQLISMRSEFMISFENSSSGVLIRRSLLYFLSNVGSILEYDLARHGLTEFDAPNHESGNDAERFNLMVSEGGGLGLCEELDVRLKLWTREVSDGTMMGNRVIHLDNLLPNGARMDAETRLIVVGFAEGANVIFPNTFSGLFTIELQSDRVKKVCHDRGSCKLIPVVSFYTPVDRGGYQDLLSSTPSQEVGGEEGGEEEKTADEAQQLLDKGSNTIKEWCFVDTFERLSHDLNTR
uniref:F-box domain-containing protein n=1 Tax=Triticum aestivum TaxID=4565 RepID=A0A3B6LWX3_WHEAT